MASNIQNYHNYFPFFPPTPPHTYPSPPQVPRKPPPHHSPNPPPPPSSATPPTHLLTPPPPSPIVIPPPHPLPPPHVIPTPPPSPPHGHHSTVIVVVFVSLGGLMFLTLLSVALCCFIKNRKKRTIQETDIIKIDEHVKVQEAIIPGPHSPQVVVLSIEKDEHVEEEIKKNEITSVLGNGLHNKSSEHHPDKALETGKISTSSSIQHCPNHKSH